jgi:hypothetical protein
MTRDPQVDLVFSHFSPRYDATGVDPNDLCADAAHRPMVRAVRLNCILRECITGIHPRVEQVTADGDAASNPSGA